MVNASWAWTSSDGRRRKGRQDKAGSACRQQSASGDRCAGCLSNHRTSRLLWKQAQTGEHGWPERYPRRRPNGLQHRIYRSLGGVASGVLDILVTGRFSRLYESAIKRDKAFATSGSSDMQRVGEVHPFLGQFESFCYDCLILNGHRG